MQKNYQAFDVHTTGSHTLSDFVLLLKPVAWWPGGRQSPPSDNFLGALKSIGGAKIRKCQCEILYKICKVQLVNKCKDNSNSGISIAIQLSNSFWE